MENYLMLIDGVELCYSKYIPEKPKAIILINHGFAEHLRRYDYIAEQLFQNNYGVYRYDLRAHGKTKAPLGHIESFNDFIEDANKMINLINSENKDIPIFMFGHSMGGLITALYGIAYPNRLRGQIFSGAALDILPSSKGIKRYIIKLGAIILPKVKIKNPISEEICSVKEVFVDYLNDPLVLKEASFKFYYEFLKIGIDKLQNNIKSYNYPCFITHGELDNISPSRISIDFYNAIQCEDKDYKIYKGLYHEILNEIERDQVIEDMVQWLDKRSI